MVKITLYSVVTAMLFLPSLAFSYDDQKVHPDINEHAAYQSQKLLDWINKIGFSDQSDMLKAPFIGQSIKALLRQGGTDEDNLARPLLHFHDPLQPWSSAGLWGTTSASVDWAQRSDNGESWQKARDHFYLALATGSETEFATTFKTLGQLMHLVSDLAVPAHARNDAHPGGDLYETWTSDRDNRNLLIYTGTTVDQAIFSQAIPTGSAPAPITALWDHDVYNGTNPADTIATGPAAPGLAEYTNANFFSQDTFTGYPYPLAGPGTLQNTDWIYPEVVVAEDGKPDLRVYYWDSVGSSTIRKAGTSLITLDVMAKNANPPWQIDDNVSRDYASLLVPAAVGYSTALLDYFFRGDIDLKSDPSAGGYLLFNNSDEEMTGDFAVYYDNADGTRSKIPGAEWLNTTVAPKSRLPVAGFSLPDNLADPAKYVLVFQGQMGAENGAVAGRVVSLRPFGLLAIEIIGNLYNANGNPSGGSGPIMYLTWDVGRNVPLVLPKTGGGLFNDLIAAFGYETNISPVNPLFSTSDVHANVRIPSSSSLGAHLVYSWQNGVMGWPDNLVPCDTVTPIIYQVTTNIADNNQQTPNDYGVVDTWSDNYSDIYIENTNVALWPDEDGYGYCGWNNHGELTLTWNTISSYDIDLVGGGASPDMFVGYRANTIVGTGGTAIPTPAITKSIALTSNNLSGASTQVISGRLVYTTTATWAFYSQLVSQSLNYVNHMVSFESSINGSGTFYTIDGIEYPISYVFGESAAKSKHPTSAWEALDSYSGSRQVSYVSDELHISSALDTVDNIVTMIAVQNVDTGEASANLSPPVAPFYQFTFGTEGPVVYANRATYYHIRTICAAVDDAATQNPWDIPNNTALTAELQSAISQYVAANPPGENNHWLISTGIYKIQ